MTIPYLEMFFLQQCLLFRYSTIISSRAVTLRPRATHWATLSYSLFKANPGPRTILGIQFNILWDIKVITDESVRVHLSSCKRHLSSMMVINVAVDMIRMIL
ncbi:hypothetical protein ACHAXM_005053, partial [Skeletonema potamos]